MSEALEKEGVALGFDRFENIRSLILLMTLRCNLKCKMCGQVSFFGEDPEKRMFIKEEIRFEDLKRVLDERPSWESLHLFGGEPMTYRFIGPLMELARERAQVVWMTTNGTIIGPHLDSMIRNLSGLTVSIDSSNPDENDASRGVIGTTERILKNFRALAAVRKPFAPVVVFNSVITHHNYHALEKSLMFFETEFSNGFDMIQFHLPRFVQDSLGQEHEKFMMQEFGCHAKTWEGWRGHGEGIDLEILQNQINKVKDHPKVIIYGIDKADQLQGFFKNPKFPSINGLYPPEAHCKVMDKVLTIQPNGNVVLCTDFPDYVLGNIYQESLRDIWNNEPMRRLRLYLRKHTFFPICAKCPRAVESMHLSMGAGLKVADRFYKSMRQRKHVPGVLARSSS